MRPVIPVAALPEHPFLVFPDGLLGSAGAQARLAILAGREVKVAPSLDRTLAAASDIMPRLEQNLAGLVIGQAEIQAELRRLVEGQRALFAHFGIPSLPIGGSDRAGPSGTHHDDTE
ncbi:hypothetical protein L2E82_11196 [Cichorium intybus]|uniref:Uncharacterized protein n=1 Tax=Cichorium intybus TaxID=13427 RepID=A0ACB9GD90_CICIN|nr:hypothetical protein L2E82_11196 [Cichorium intybus]